MTTIFDGRALAKQKEEILKQKISRLEKKPKMLAVGAGDEKDIELYIRMKENVAQRIGIEFEKMIFPGSVSQDIMLDYISEKNEKVDGILLELPLPKNIDSSALMEKVSPRKDIDCMTYENLGKLLYGKPRFLPATVRAVKDILEFQISNFKFQIEKPLSFKNAVVIGGGIELGKPLALFLSDMGAAVSLCRSTTRDLAEYTKNADIIISAVGKPNLVNGDMVKAGVIVIDAGINLVDGKTAGDVDFESVSPKATFITPVPGGVGPLTIVSLFENLLDSIIQ